MTLVEIITFISIALTYFIYSSVNGFSDIIQKCLKVKGNVNLLINSILFMLLIRLVIDNVPIYMNILEVIYKRFISKPLLEGQDESSLDLSVRAIDTRIENLMKLVDRKYEEHDNMIESKEKDALFSKIMRFQRDLDNLRTAKAALVSP